MYKYAFLEPNYDKKCFLIISSFIHTKLELNTIKISTSAAVPAYVGERKFNWILYFSFFL